ncbi:hypothetical protein KQI36_10665 [Clostridium senegalense]|uniref:hypothetical protein n=1 Tax=Clostridium senegalense TaxID=1465809 RepID=UPI001C10DDCA|nr:hypothetical protein [Clostridium senegalense]MBU5227102.1 hypothetical protein [Clostridium senegalense]
MKFRHRRFIASFVIFFMFFATFTTGFMSTKNNKVLANEINSKNYDSVLNKNLDCISDILLNKNLNELSDWEVIGLGALGKTVPKEYLEKKERAIRDSEDIFNETTDYERTILSIVAAGGDPRNIGNKNLIDILYNINLEEEYNIYAEIYDLIAMDCGNFNIPNKLEFKTNLINRIIYKKIDGGGWEGTFGIDPDTTAMAITALSNYYDSNSEVKKTVDESIEALSKTLDDNGNFMGNDESTSASSESISQTIIALCSLGIDPTTCDKFTRNGQNLLDLLLEFKTDDGGFAHQKNSLDRRNDMSTEQGFLALVAYKQFKEGKKGSVYLLKDFSDETNTKENIEINNLTDLNSLKLNSEANIKLNIKNNLDKDQSAVVIVALYNEENNKMINYFSNETTIKNNSSSEEINQQISIPETGNYKIKVFLWDSLKDMNPLTDEVIMRIQQF